MTMPTLGSAGHIGVARAIREARNEVLASADTALCRCYDYLQDAHERMITNIDEAASAVYKATEVLTERFGGEHNAVAVLGKTLKDAKRVANEGRHIPKKGQSQRNGLGRSIELGKAVVRAYERYLLAQPGGC